jgi:PAS domain S-box-containing protein
VGPHSPECASHRASPILSRLDLEDRPGIDLPLDKPRLLFVDDYPAFAQQLGVILADEYEIEVVSNGLEALEATRRSPPALVLTDVVMPGLDGIGLLKQLRADSRTSTVPVLLLSGRAPEEARAEAFESGADGYLTKPFTLRELRARIKAVLEGTKLRFSAARAEALAQAEERATRERAEILESITDAVYALDEQWRFTYINQRALDHFGRSREELLGQAFWDVLPANRGTTLQHQFEHTVAAQQSVKFEILSPASGRWIEVHAYPRRRGIAVSFQDIGARKQAIAERERMLALEREARQEAEDARREAERLGRLKDEFLATLSHELRTPLNAILGWASVLRHKGSTDADFDRALESIERNSRLQATIISDLLDMSRIVAGRIRLDMRQVALQEVLRAALDAIEPAARAKNLGLQTNWGSRTVQVQGDAERLQQVFWNLLSNAVKYTPDRGRISVTLVPTDSQVEVAIQDNGIGIAPEFLPHAFDRFRQGDSSTTRRTGGIGLGLSIVKSLVELHGGSVQAKSEGRDRGATLIVRLPTATAAMESAGMRESLAQESQVPELEIPALPGTRVLLVDDDSDARSLISRILQDRGARVRAATGAKEALRIRDTEHFDVLVSDIGMPEVDGYGLIGMVRQLPRDRGGTLPAVALTAFAQPSDRTKALRAGFQSHVAKPVEARELVTTIGTLVAE